MTLRILHIAPYYLPDVEFGGPVFSVSSLCEAMVERGFEVTVFTIGYQPDFSFPEETNINGVRVVYHKGNAGHPCQLSFQLWSALEAQAKNYDVVHFHTWWNILIFRAIQIVRRQGVKMVLSPRGMLGDYSFTHNKTRLKRLFQKSWGRQLVEHITMHGTSMAEAAEIHRRTGKPIAEIEVVPNLLGLHITHQYADPGEGLVLGLLSRLHHKKGIEVLLDAVALCPVVDKLLLGGTGDPAYEVQLRKQVADLGLADRVEFYGWVDQSSKAHFFSRINVFVLPSFHENFANVVAEAWAAGKPVIVSQTVGLSDYVEQYGLGWVCQPDAPNLAAAIRHASEGRHRWPAMGQAALRLVRDRFTDDRIIEEYLDMYRRSVAGKMPARTMVTPLHGETPVPGNQDTYILGLNAHHADASAALFKNGILLAAIEEERLRRIKHWAGFPAEAIIFCLGQAGISLEQVDHIAIGRDPKAKWQQKASFMLRRPQALNFAVRGRLSNAATAISIEGSLAAMVRPEINALIEKRITYVEHHRSHLASAFFASPFQKAALLSVDGSGDFTTTMMGVGDGTQIEVLQSIDFPHSLGVLYSAFTQLLGFPHYGEEYKVMGLAPYGQPVYYEKLKNVITWLDDGTFRLGSEWFRPPQKGYVSYDKLHRPLVPVLFDVKMETMFGKTRQAGEPITQHHKDLAASVQKMLEETLFHMLRHLHKTTGLTTLCLAGGVAQNSVANGKITLHTPFEKVYIPSAGHDAGLAMGAAMYLHHHIMGQPRLPAVSNAYTGGDFSSEDIALLLQRRRLPYRYLPVLDQLCSEVADCLAAGGVVGWFRGRSEFGPRALGHRSILADPRRADAKELLNRKIKRRESFRPFAPSIMREFTADYFELADEVPFMERVFPIKMDKRALIPAVTHVDGTGRLQTVSREDSPDFYQLIATFYNKTGIPLVLNTSFNENEPIVNSPSEALACFERTEMDMLVLGDYIITRHTTAYES